MCGDGEGWRNRKKEKEGKILQPKVLFYLGKREKKRKKKKRKKKTQKRTKAMAMDGK